VAYEFQRRARDTDRHEVILAVFAGPLRMSPPRKLIDDHMP
jgi:hypothetical protein